MVNVFETLDSSGIRGAAGGEREMMPVGIPAWNTEGVIPPIPVGDPFSRIRSPYVVPLDEVMVRFGMTSERRMLLTGLLRYRSALHAVGLIQGFQWLDGSFLEDVERMASRQPNDIDVVTFYHLPPGATQASIAQRIGGLFPQSSADLRAIKQAFHVDAYGQCLDVQAERIVGSSTYWYSMWSHRRNGVWKGYVQVDLAPAEDAAAGRVLASLGVQP
jgi:hypothetical protein